jgi:hypothetical protein
VVVNASDGGGGGGGDDGPGTIQLSASGYDVNENDGSVTITVQRAGGHVGAASVKYALSPGTAKPGKDYLPRTGTFKWNDGEDDDKTFDVPIKNDSAPEPDETFSVHLSKATGATLGTSAATVTIHDNDSPGCPPASAAAPSEVAASGLSSSTIEVRWAEGSTGKALHVERSSLDGAFREIAVLPASATSFVDRGLPAGATFLYRVSIDGAAGESLRSAVVAGATDGGLGACASGSLCLAGGRFEATASWRSEGGAPLRQASGSLVASGARAGSLGLADANGAQVMVAVRDACADNDHFAVDLSTVADAELVVRVRDTLTGRTWAYYAPGGGQPIAVRDLDALASCP